MISIIHTTHKEHPFFYRISGGALLVGIGVLIGWGLFTEKQVDYLLSLFTNLLSIFVTVFVLDLLVIFDAVVQRAIRDHHVKLLVVNIETETITRWIE